MTMNTSRRAILAGAASLAAVPALATPSAGTHTPDPIFAAIERHRAAHVAHGLSCAEESRLEETLPSDRTTWRATVWEPMPPKDCPDAPEWIAHQFVHDAAGTDSCVTLCELVSTIPTTIAGVAALVGYLREHVENGGETATTFTGKFDPANGEPLYLDIDAKLLETLEAAASSLAA